MKMTKDVELAIEVMHKLKDRKTPARVQDLAQEVGTTKFYLEQLANKLKKAGLIVVKRGPGGGILRSTQDDFSVSRIYDAMGKSFKINNDTKAGQILAKVNELLILEKC